MSKSATRVFPVAMDERSVEMLAMAFKVRAHGACILSEENDAEVALIDLDKEGAEERYAAFHKANPGLPVVGLSDTKPGNPDIIHVAKPVSVMNLVASLQEMAKVKQENPTVNKVTTDKIERAMKAIEAKKAAVSLGSRIGDMNSKDGVTKKNNIPLKSDEVHFDPTRFLLGKMFEAGEKIQNSEQIAVLDCWHGKKIIVDSANEVIYSELTDNQIRNLAIAPFDHELAAPISIQHQGKDQLKEEINKTKKELLRTYSKEVFLWNLALLTSRGRLPEGISMDETVYLSRWPNLTRLQMTPNTMQIIAYWVNQPSSLMELAGSLMLPADEVFTVYTAASAAGLSGCANRESDKLLQPEVIVPHKKRSIFSSIIRHLGKHTDRDNEAVA